MVNDTIFALASAVGRAGIAVVRLSGPAARGALASLRCAPTSPRTASMASFKDPRSGELLDDGLLIWFPAPGSFTGEDVAELHVHGGRAVVDGLLAALSGINGLRPAEPGEFTRRAFEHGKMDLTPAEALADLVDAETRAQKNQALQQMGGALKDLYDDWRVILIQVLAHLEAVIDFPDENLPQETTDRIWVRLRNLEKAIAKHLDDGGRGERIRDGIKIAIIGPPNAGKSSLLNFLVQRDVAIVSDIPGTTRDVIEVHMDLGGFAVTVADTAGLRAAGNIIEDEGIRRALMRAQAADLKIALFDGDIYPTLDAATLSLIDSDTMTVINKADLIQGDDHHLESKENTLFISLKTGVGVDAFLLRLQEWVSLKMDRGTAAPLTRARHRHALNDCVDAVRRAIDAPLQELAAQDLRLAARALGRITGRVDVEEILDVIFRDFCIGK